LFERHKQHMEDGGDKEQKNKGLPGCDFKK
jgi:hypothetical protein